jgi:hypothetical protein
VKRAAVESRWLDRCIFVYMQAHIQGIEVMAAADATAAIRLYYYSWLEVVITIFNSLMQPYSIYHFIPCVRVISTITRIVISLDTSYEVSRRHGSGKLATSF